MHLQAQGRDEIEARFWQVSNSGSMYAQALTLRSAAADDGPGRSELAVKTLRTVEGCVLDSESFSGCVVSGHQMYVGSRDDSVHHLDLSDL